MIGSASQFEIPDNGCPRQSTSDDLRADNGRDVATMLPGTNASPPG
jgi:hypothetical protein